MLPFKNVTLSDYEVIFPYLLESENMNCWFSFANLVCWQELLNPQWALAHDFIFLRYHIDNNTIYAFIGRGNMAQALDVLLQNAQENGAPLRLVCHESMREQLEKWYPHRFNYQHSRNSSDYIYLREHLATLKGSIYQAKRNQTHQFKRNYNYTCLPITKDLIEECIAFEQKWFESNHRSTEEGLSKEENKVALIGLQHFEALHLSGIVLRVNEEVVAYSFGQAINKETFDVQVGRANIDYTGVYAMLYHQLALSLPPSFKYLNFEEDLGVEGLRKMKLLFHPYMLYHKYIAVQKWPA